jgi:WD40 repeat protein
MAIGYGSGEIMFVNPKSTEVIFKYRKTNFLIVGHNAAIKSTVFAYNDNHLYIADQSNKIAKLNIDTRKEESSWTNKKNPISVLAITHNDQYLIGAVKSRIKVWNTQSGVIFIKKA